MTLVACCSYEAMSQNDPVLNKDVRSFALTRSHLRLRESHDRSRYAHNIEETIINTTLVVVSRALAMFVWALSQSTARALRLGCRLSCLHDTMLWGEHDNVSPGRVHKNVFGEVVSRFAEQQQKKHRAEKMLWWLAPGAPKRDNGGWRLHPSDGMLHMPDDPLAHPKRSLFMTHAHECSQEAGNFFGAARR